MTQDILDAFDEADNVVSDSRLEFGEGGGVAVAEPKSAQCFDLDKWCIRKGAEIHDAWLDARVIKRNDHKEALIDAHGALFEPCPVLAENPADERRAKWFRRFVETPEYRALHSRTCLDSQLSGLATKAVWDEWVAYAAEQPDENDEGTPGGGDGATVADDIGRVQSVNRAAKEASETVDDAQNTMDGLGLGGGDVNGSIGPADIGEYFRTVRRNPRLRRIMDMAGRMRRLCSGLQRSKTTHGRDDTVGVELAGDVGSLLPVELASIASGIPELELLATYRLSQRQAMCRQYAGRDKTGRGPIVCIVDESGSMENGNRIAAAKGMALALAWLAKQQRRWIALVGFSGHEVSGTKLIIPPGVSKPKQLLEWTSHFYRGGTSARVPLHDVPFVFWPEFVSQGMRLGKTDVILITDAQMSLPDSIVDEYRRWSKTEQVKTYGIIIGEESAGDLAQVCDKHWCVASLGLDGSATETVLSI